MAKLERHFTSGHLKGITIPETRKSVGGSPHTKPIKVKSAFGGSSYVVRPRRKKK